VPDTDCNDSGYRRDLSVDGSTTAEPFRGAGVGNASWGTGRAAPAPSAVGRAFRTVSGGRSTSRPRRPPAHPPPPGGRRLCQTFRRVAWRGYRKAVTDRPAARSEPAVDGPPDGSSPPAGRPRGTASVVGAILATSGRGNFPELNAGAMLTRGENKWRHRNGVVESPAYRSAASS